MLQDIIQETKYRREADKARYEAHDGQLCMLCGAYGNDKRSLFISCFYDISEVIPEAIDLFLCSEKVKNKGWYVRICKYCRGKLLGKLREWRNESVSRRDCAKDHDGHPDDWRTDANIPVRIDGRIVMMTEEQYEEYRQSS